MIPVWGAARVRPSTWAHLSAGDDASALRPLPPNRPLPPSRTPPSQQSPSHPQHHTARWPNFPFVTRPLAPPRLAPPHPHAPHLGQPAPAADGVLSPRGLVPPARLVRPCAPPLLSCQLPPDQQQRSLRPFTSPAPPTDTRALSSIPLQPLRSSSARSSALPAHSSHSSPSALSRARIPWQTTPSGAPVVRAQSPYLLLSRAFATPAPPSNKDASASGKDADELKALLSSSPDAPSSSKAVAAAADKPSKDVAAKDDDGTKKLTLWDKVKKEARHYWHGTKLLGKEIRISAKLQRKVLNGGTLTRREQRQVRPPYPLRPVPSSSRARGAPSFAPRRIEPDADAALPPFARPIRSSSGRRPTCSG